MRLLLLINIFSLSNSMASKYFIPTIRNQIRMKTSKGSKKQIDVPKFTPPYKPKTKNQENYVKNIKNETNKIIIGIGPAGTGKTLFACNYAAEQLKSEKIQKIILTRPIVPVEEDLGYLPGKINNKMEPWTRPLFDILEEYFHNKDIVTMLKSGKIEIAPLAYMRGRTFKNSIIIADEMQNSSPSQMLMTTTRIGENSKLLITGDLNQSDRYENNGLKELIKKIDDYKSFGGKSDGISIISFDSNDIQRSKIVNKIIEIYENRRKSLPLPKSSTIKTEKEEIVSDKLKKKIKDELDKQLKEKKSKKNENNENNKNKDAAMIPLKDMKKINKKNN